MSPKIKEISENGTLDKLNRDKAYMEVHRLTNQLEELTRKYESLKAKDTRPRYIIKEYRTPRLLEEELNGGALRFYRVEAISKGQDRGILAALKRADEQEN